MKEALNVEVVFGESNTVITRDHDGCIFEKVSSVPNSPYFSSGIQKSL